MSNVVFEDYSIEVKNVIKEKAISFLDEIGEEILSRTKRNIDPYNKTSATSGSYRYKVDEDGLSVSVGSDYMNAIWEEFGTGIHAMNNDGRKTKWKYLDESTGRWHTTSGKKPRRHLFHAFDSSKDVVHRRADQIFGEI